MTGPVHLPLWFARFVLGFNVAATLGCAVLAGRSPSSAGVLLAVGGCAFFGFAAIGFALMLRLRGSASRLG